MPKIKSLNKIIIAVALASGLFSILVATPPPSAQAASSTTTCQLKINYDKCMEAIKKCDAYPVTERDNCVRRNIDGKFGDVIKECQDKFRPRECHAAVQEKCDTKRGDEKNKCREREAKKQPTSSGQINSFFGESNGKYQCGNTDDAVNTKFNFGCLGTKAPKNTGPIEDLLFALIRFLSVGVGIIIVGAIILAGIQYTSSEGNPETTQEAKNKVRSAVIGLIIYLFTFSIIQFLVPGGIF